MEFTELKKTFDERIWQVVVSASPGPLCCSSYCAVSYILIEKIARKVEAENNLSDWLSSSDSKDEIERQLQRYGVGQSSNDAADSNNSISKYGSCSFSVENVWTPPPSTQICDAEKLRHSTVVHS